MHEQVQGRRRVQTVETWAVVLWTKPAATAWIVAWAMSPANSKDQASAQAIETVGDRNPVAWLALTGVATATDVAATVATVTEAATAVA